MVQSLIDKGLEHAEGLLHERRQADARAGVTNDDRVIFALEAVGQARDREKEQNGGD